MRLGREPSNEEIGKEIGMSEKRVTELMRRPSGYYSIFRDAGDEDGPIWEILWQTMLMHPQMEKA